MSHITVATSRWQFLYTFISIYFIDGPCRGLRCADAIPATCRYQHGFTILEVITGLSIMSIVGMLATGAIGVMRNQIVTAELNGLVTDLAYMRSTAISKRQTVTLCTSDNGESCTKESPWQQGWIIFTDANRNRKLDGDDRLLRVQAALSHATQLQYGSGYYRYIIYSPTGMVFPGGTFKFCGKGYYARAIIVYWTGRARVSSRTPKGKALECPLS